MNGFFGIYLPENMKRIFGNLGSVAKSWRSVFEKLESPEGGGDENDKFICGGPNTVGVNDRCQNKTDK